MTEYTVVYEDKKALSPAPAQGDHAEEGRCPEEERAYPFALLARDGNVPLLLLARAGYDPLAVLSSPLWTPEVYGPTS